MKKAIPLILAVAFTLCARNITQKTILILLLILPFQFGFTQNIIKNDLERQHLSGKVKTVSEITYQCTVKSGKISKGAFKEKETITFNEKGSKIKEHSHDGFLTDLYGFKYDVHGNVIEEDDYQLADKDDINGNKYDSNNTKYNGDFTMSSDLLHEKRLIKYDIKGNMIRIDRYQGGNLTDFTIYKYDEKDFMIERDDYDFGNNSNGTVIFKYDEKGNRIEDSYLGKTTYKYDNFDKEGNWLKKITLINNKPIKLTERKIQYYSVEIKTTTK